MLHLNWVCMCGIVLSQGETGPRGDGAYVDSNVWRKECSQHETFSACVLLGVRVYKAVVFSKCMDMVQFCFKLHL